MAEIERGEVMASAKVAHLRSKKKLFALGRLKAGTLNKTEQAYRDRLQALQASGEILWWRFEPVKLRLADNCSYCPDFLVMSSDGELQAHECKGSLKFIQDDAKAKIKIAADIFPWRFFLVAPNPQKAGGGWQVLEVGNGNKVEVWG